MCQGRGVTFNTSFCVVTSIKNHILFASVYNNFLYLHNCIKSICVVHPGELSRCRPVTLTSHLIMTMESIVLSHLHIRGRCSLLSPFLCTLSSLQLQLKLLFTCRSSPMTQPLSAVYQRGTGRNPEESSRNLWTGVSRTSCFLAPTRLRSLWLIFTEPCTHTHTHGCEHPQLGHGDSGLITCLFT